MYSNIKTAEEFFKTNNIPDIGSEDDILIHGVKEKDISKSLVLVKSFFEEGVHITGTATARGGSILATAALQHNDKSLKHQVSHYTFKDGIFNVIIKIPQELEGIYLGNCRKHYGNAGNQNSKNAILDYFKFDSIPREFIVGISILTDATDPENNRIYIQNPYYYDNEKNKEVNTKTLVEKLNQKIQKSSTLKVLTSKEECSDAEIQFAEYNNNEDLVFHMKQKNNYLNSKNLNIEDLANLFTSL